jgi:subtilisin family serine protease
LLVAAPGSAYRVQSGTSFAAAEVTGVVALLLERNPALSPDAVRATLLATGTRSARQPGIVLVDAYRALIAQAAMK